jgi:hypothetical protein
VAVARSLARIGLVILLGGATTGCVPSRQIASSGSGQCAHVPWSGNSVVLPGTNVVLAQCFARNSTQQWTFKGSQIISVTGMCMDAQAANGGDLPQVVVAPCNGNPNQVWKVQDGHVMASGGRCLDIPGGNLAEGTPLTVSACSSSSSQHWTLR